MYKSVDVNYADVVVFWHIAQMNHWRSIVQEQSIKLACFPRVIIGNLGLCDVPELPFSFEIGYSDKNILNFEYPTLQILWQHCQNNSGMVLYCHTKGVSYGITKWEKDGNWWKDMSALDKSMFDEMHFDDRKFYSNLREWRLFMEYFMITRREDCIHAIKQGNDLCGVSFYPDPELPISSTVPAAGLPRHGTPAHFQGNFWWANNDYIRCLLSPAEFSDLSKYSAPRASSEYWVCSGSPKVKNLWSTNHSMYLHGMPWHQYMKVLL